MIFLLKIMELKVYFNSKSEKPIFCRCIQTNDAVSLDYSLLLRSMKLLFGPDCIVIFEIH